MATHSAQRQQLVERLGRLGFADAGTILAATELSQRIREPEQVAELFAIAGRELEAIEQLTGCVAQLHEVQAAKAQLATLTPAEVRAYLGATHG